MSTEPATQPRLTALSHGAGCACKLSLDELTGILDGVTWPVHEDLLVGLSSGDDAAVWRQGDGRVMVATTDFFTPLVDDERDWGRIAATNAISDVYGMGATPRVALNLVGWPRDLDFTRLRAVLDGAVEVASAAGYVIAGGHSIDSVEPLFGQVVIGDAEEAEVLTNAGASPDQALILSKPIGTGIVTTALKRSEPLHPDGDSALDIAYRAAVAEMTRLNRDAARIAVDCHASAATDVTGFGLLGHLHRLTKASGTAAVVDADQVPLLPGADELLDAGFVPGGSQRNADQAARFLTSPVPDRTRLLLADAQTSGGLLFTVDMRYAARAVDSLRAGGHTAAVVGRTVEGVPGSIQVVVE